MWRFHACVTVYTTFPSHPKGRSGDCVPQHPFTPPPGGAGGFGAVLQLLLLPQRGPRLCPPRLHPPRSRVATALMMETPTGRCVDDGNANTPGRDRTGHERMVTAVGSWFAARARGSCWELLLQSMRGLMHGDSDLKARCLSPQRRASFKVAQIQLTVFCTSTGFGIEQDSGAFNYSEREKQL